MRSPVVRVVAARIDAGSIADIADQLFVLVLVLVLVARVYQAIIIVFVVVGHG